MRLQGKVVLITGASEGIGAACAALFRDRGCRLVLVSRSEEKLRATARGEDVVIAGDITSFEARRSMIATALDRCSRIDVLVNNAGVGVYAPAHVVPPEQARTLWELNFFAPLDLIQLVVPQMKAQGSGAVVNIGSIAGQVTLPWLTLYSASKFALGSLTDGLRVELRQHGIHTMIVCPGYVKTGFQQHVLGGRPPEAVSAAGKWAITPEDCARDIVRGLERNARTVVTPKIGWLMIGFNRLFPKFVERQLEAIYLKQGYQV